MTAGGEGRARRISATSRTRGEREEDTVTSRTVNPGPDAGNAHVNIRPVASVAGTGSSREVENMHPNAITGCSAARTAETCATPPRGVVVVEVVATTTDAASTTVNVTSVSATRAKYGAPMATLPGASAGAVHSIVSAPTEDADTGATEPNRQLVANAWNRAAPMPPARGATMTRVPPSENPTFGVTESTSGGFDTQVMDARFDALGAVAAPELTPSFTCPVDAAPNEPRASSPMLTTQRTTAEDSTRARSETGPVEHHTPLASSSKFSPIRTTTSPSRTAAAVVEKRRGGTCNKYCAVVSWLRVRAPATDTALNPNLNARSEPGFPPLASATRHFARTSSRAAARSTKRLCGLSFSRVQKLASGAKSDARWSPNTSTVPLFTSRSICDPAAGTTVSTTTGFRTNRENRPEFEISAAARVPFTDGSGVSECRSLTVTCVRPRDDAGTTHRISDGVACPVADTHTPPN
mmetsp:Transcript_12317/g.51546  ORF Transcript_12317/g.51546 Transcript_12317/m.51546 type:complete len:467 (-) Transcript_12317:932-2332(-)